MFWKLLKNGKPAKRYNLFDATSVVAYTIGGVTHHLADPPDGCYSVTYSTIDGGNSVVVLYDPHDVVEVSDSLDGQKVDKKNTIFVVGGNPGVVVGVPLDVAERDLSGVVATMIYPTPSGYSH